MSRAIRRQQRAAPKEAAGQPTRPPTLGPRQQRQTRGARPTPPQKRGLRLGQPRWTENIVSELKKVTWPTRDETAYLTMVVILVAVMVGLVLGGVDIFFNWLMERLLLR